MAVTGIDLGKYKLGWHDTEQYVNTPEEGHQRGRRQRDLVDEVRAGVDDEVPAERAQAVRAQAHARVVREEHARHRLRRHLLLPEAHRQAGLRLGHAARGDEGDVREARHPRSRAQVPRRRHRAVRERGRVPQEPRGPRAARRHLLRHGHRAARAPRHRAEVPRHRDPARRQQVRRAQLRGLVRRFVHLRAAGHARRHAAAGVLPHQRGERRAVRAHVDHRRRRLVGALRRGLLGAGVLDRLVALGGGRTDREAGRAHPLHDDPELVAERVQPRDEARPRRNRSRPSSGSTATSARSSR